MRTVIVAAKDEPLPGTIAEGRSLVHVQPYSREQNTRSGPVRESLGPVFVRVFGEPVREDGVSWPDLTNVL